jgi:hypothetical protein
MGGRAVLGLSIQFFAWMRCLPFFHWNCELLFDLFTVQ